MSTVSPSLTQAQLKNAQIVSLDNEGNPTPRDIRLVASLIDRFRDPFVAERLNSFRNLSVIARVLGPVRTRDELIPYVHEFADDDDAVLLVIAEELAKMIDLIGGYDYVGVILEPLQTLAGSEDSAIREKVVESIHYIASVTTVDQALRCLLPFFRHLAAGEWFTSRQTACAIFHIIYPIIPHSKVRTELREIFNELARDESPMVRRAACQALPNIVGAVEPENLSVFIIAYQTLVRDEQDSIRLTAVTAGPAIAAAARTINEIARIFTPIFALCTDKSWRVRYVAASKYPELCKAVVENQFKGVDFVDSFSKLMTDSEPEVRSAAASQVADVAKILGGEKTLRVLLGPLKTLTNDSCEFTRAALARSIMRISDVLTQSDTTEHLLPLFLQFLKDPSPDVRLSLMADLSCVKKIVGEAQIVESVIPAVCQLAVEKNWRVRLAIIEQIPHIAKQLGPSFYHNQLADLSLAWMGDSVASIREASASNLVSLSAVYGTDWATMNVLPRVVHLLSRKSYQYRQLAAKILADLIPVLGEAYAYEKVEPIVNKIHAEETVINVRMNIMHIYHELGMISSKPDDIKKIIGIIEEELRTSKDLEMEIIGPSCIDNLKKHLLQITHDLEKQS